MLRALPLATDARRRCAVLGVRRGAHALVACWTLIALSHYTSAIGWAAEDAPLAPSQLRALAEFHQADSAAQQRWLETLLGQRLPRAVKLATAPPERDELTVYHEQILARILSGKSLSDHGLAKLLQQTESLEGRAIERLANDYRRAAAEAFPDDQRQCELRIEAWQSVKGSWELAGADPELQPRLMDWLGEATNRIQQGQTYRLPARPRFGLLTAMRRPKADVVPAFARQGAGNNELATRAMGSVSGNVVVAAGLPIAIRAEPRPRVDSTPAPPGSNQSWASRELAAVLLAANPAPAAPPPDQLAALPLSLENVRSASPEPVAAPALPAVAHGIDVSELNDRVAGYKVTLGGLKGKLHDKGDWTEPRLSVLVEELAELITRRGDLLLYVRLVADDVGAANSLESPAATVSLVGGKISAARQRLETLSDQTVGAAERRELARLSQLSRRLVVLTAELQQQDR